MDRFLELLLQYNKDVEPVVDRLFDDIKKDGLKITPLASDLINDYKKFLLGGKKLRGFEIYLGYKMFGGNSEQTGLLASLVIEIIHSFLLIHDDIMDRDDLRRGSPTLHKKYAKDGDEHFGIALALNVGDEGAFWAYELLNSLDIPPERLVKATKHLSRILMEVGIGQALDITYEREKRLTEEAVLEVHHYKTAHYTIPGPLQIGAILAGADEQKLKAIRDFGIPVGVAFQLRDDELGMFSTEKELGKPVDSDLEEGKVTILIVKALQNAKGEQLEFIKMAHGNQKLSIEQVEKVRQIISSCGALDYSKQLSKKLVEEGKIFIPQVTDKREYQQLLSQLADFMIERKS